MPKKKWSDVDPRVRRALIGVAMVDGALRAAALMDLRRRRSAEVRGPKKAWGLAITLVNSAGVLPTVYFLRGRRPTGEGQKTA